LPQVLTLQDLAFGEGRQSGLLFQQAFVPDAEGGRFSIRRILAFTPFKQAGAKAPEPAYDRCYAAAWPAIPVLQPAHPLLPDVPKL